MVVPTAPYMIRCRDPQHAAGEAARIVLDSFVRAGERNFALALSGGRSAPELFRELTRQCGLRSCELGAADFFWADERCVHPDHKDSNFGLARAELLTPLAIPPTRIHRLLGELPPDLAAMRANADWAQWSAQRRSSGASLNLVLLGVGEDGHVASLFPDNLVRDLTTAEPFQAVVGPKAPPQRLTMGYQVLWEARAIVILGIGPEKMAVASASIEGRQDTPLARLLAGRLGKCTTIITHERPST